MGSTCPEEGFPIECGMHPTFDYALYAVDQATCDDSFLGDTDDAIDTDTDTWVRRDYAEPLPDPGTAGQVRGRGRPDLTKGRRSLWSKANVDA